MKKSQPWTVVMHHVDNCPDNVIIPVHAHVRAKGPFNARAQAQTIHKMWSGYGWKVAGWFRNDNYASTLVLASN